MERFLHQIKGIFVLDNEGKRLFSKAYKEATMNQTTIIPQEHLERTYFAKTQKTPAHGDVDVFILNDQICVHKQEVDLFFYLYADASENELVLSEVLSALIDSLQLIFRSQLEKRTFLENFDLIVLTVDEMMDDGLIMEIDPQTIAQKVVSTESGLTTGLGGEDADALNQVFHSAKEQVTEIASSLFSF